MKLFIKKYWGFALIALVAIVFCVVIEPSMAGVASLTVEHTKAGSGMGLACLAFMFRGPLMDQFNPDGGGGGGGTLSPFETKVLAGIQSVKNQTDTIEKNFGDLDKDTKKLQEDFGKHVTEFNGLPSQVADISRSLSQIQLKVSQQRTGNFGSAIERICADENMRNAVNGIVRSAANHSGQKSFNINDAQKKAVEDYKRALTTGATPGSAYINAQLITEIYSLIAEFGIWKGFDVIPVSTATTKLIVDTTDPDMLWVDEGAEPAEAAYAGANVTAAIKKMLGWIGVSNELLEDSEVDIARYLLPKFANATAKRLDFACTSANGDADTVDGGMNGIFYGGTASVAAAGNVSVATLDYEDFLNAMLAVNAAALSRPCKWFIHPQMLVRCLSIKDLNGRPIFLPSIDAPSLGAIGSILGYPVVLSHTAPNVDGVSKKIAVFGDPMGEAVCLRSDFQFAASDQVKFTEDKTVFRARARAAAKVKQADAFGILTTAAA